MIHLVTGCADKLNVEDAVTALVLTLAGDVICAVTGGMCIDKLAVVVCGALNDIIEGRLVTAYALIYGVTEGVAVSFNGNAGAFVAVVASLATHSLSLLVCYCIVREVLYEEGNLFSLCIVCYVGDLLDLAVFCKIVDNDAFFISVAVIVCDSDGNLGGEVIREYLVVNLNGEVEDGCTCEHLLFFLGHIVG